MKTEAIRNGNAGGRKKAGCLGAAGLRGETQGRFIARGSF
jgi:hypothetical protein